jgi:serpin B
MNTSPDPTAVTDETTRTAAVAGASNRLALELDRQWAGGEGGNRFFSPVSIATALGIAYAGAGGETAREMAAVLHFDVLPPSEFPLALGSLAKQLMERPGVSLQIANRLWGQQGYDFRPEFLAQTDRAHGGALETIDFEQPDSARQTINAWVADRTSGKVAALIPPGVLDRATRLVLTNAIVFKANWLTPFRIEATRPEPFHPESAAPVEVPMMHQTTRLSHGEAEGVRIVELGYVGRSMSLVVLLPAEGSSLGELESRLTGDRLISWLDGLVPRRVDLSLPRFRSRSAVRLDPSLRELGLTRPFNPAQADFSGLTTRERLFLSAIVHEAVVDVDEQGTEAAAATGMAVAATMAGRPETPVVFRADRPFVYLIRDQATGAILFLGRLSDPRG